MTSGKSSIDTLYTHFIKNRKLTTDTRKIESGSIFFALKGDNFNGNEFATEAIQKGADFVVIDEGEIIDQRYIKVPNVLKYLQDFANHHRRHFKIPFIGITGSNGKTTTKELLAAVLETQLNVAYTKGNLNNHIGVPLTLLDINENHEIAIIEMGANKPKDIQELVEIAEPNFGVITNIGKAHLEGFGSLQGVIDTKSELYDFLQEEKGTVFFNAKDEVIRMAVDKFNAQRIAYNETHSGVELLSFTCSPTLSVQLRINQAVLNINSQLFGEYNATNISLAAAIGHHFGISDNNIVKGIENYQPSNNRSQITKTASNNTLILDAYNANPTSLQNAIKSFKTSNLDNKIYILGDMLEMGKDAISEHQNIIHLFDEGDKVFFVGDIFKSLETSNFKFFHHVDELNELLASKSLENKSILIKGSRGIKLEKVVEFL